jgi:hypothetical protein
MKSNAGPELDPIFLECPNKQKGTRDVELGIPNRNLHSSGIFKTVPRELVK